MSDRKGRIDQFESVFRSADKTIFRLRPIHFKHILMITDQPRREIETLITEAKRFLGPVEENDNPAWSILAQDDVHSFDECRSQIDAANPDLVVAWRNLFDPVGSSVYSLGVFVDELTQYLRPPVLLLPDPKMMIPERAIEEVMVVTNKLTGEDRLVSKGVHFTPSDGRLILCHIEDEDTFDRYMHAIERIPEIDSEKARTLIREQLLKEPDDYITSCIKAIGEAGHSFTVESVVEFGRGVGAFKRIMKEKEVDLMIFYTKDEAQIAMNGTAYSLAVEIRDIPLLML